MNKKDKILIISAFPPNRMTAGQSFTKELIERISKNFEIDLLYFNYPEHRIEIDNIDNIWIKELKISKISSIISIILGLLFFLNPLFTKRFNIKHYFLIRNLIQKNNYKYIVFNYSQVFIYSLCCLKLNKTKKIFIFHDVIYQLHNRISGIKGLFLSITAFLTEKLLLKLNKNSLIFSFSNKDKELIFKNYNVKCKVIHFYLNENILKLKLNDIEDAICLYGAWNRKENIEILQYFFSEIYQNLKKIKPTIKIYIIGSGIQKNLKLIPRDSNNISVLGFLENPYEIIAKCKCMFAPLFHGAGVKVKVIESLATGTPVIGTLITFEGIDFDEGLINISNSKDAISKILYLIENVDINYKIKLREKFLSQFYNENFLLDKILEKL